MSAAIIKDSGMPEIQAKAISKAFAQADTEVATKSDIRRLEHKMPELESRMIIKFGLMLTVASGLIVTLGKII